MALKRAVKTWAWGGTVSFLLCSLEESASGEACGPEAPWPGERAPMGRGCRLRFASLEETQASFSLLLQCR